MGRLYLFSATVVLLLLVFVLGYASTRPLPASAQSQQLPARAYLPLVSQSRPGTGNVPPTATPMATALPSPTPGGPGPTPAPAPTVAATPLVPGVVQYDITARTHVGGPITYVPLPPVGGNHWPIWINCGFYDQPIPDQEGVHSEEHGAVWITYSPNLPAGDVAQLRQLAAVEPKVVFSPYPGLPAPVVASAWDFQLYLTGVSDPRLVQFIHTYRANPWSGEPNGQCYGAAGSPNPPSPR